MIKLAQCPFCGGDPITGGNISFTTCSDSDCCMSCWSFSFEEWNSRPAEDRIKIDTLRRLSLPYITSDIAENLLNTGLIVESSETLSGYMWTQHAVDLLCEVKGAALNKLLLEDY